MTSTGSAGILTRIVPSRYIARFRLPASEATADRLKQRVANIGLYESASGPSADRSYAEWTTPVSLGLKVGDALPDETRVVQFGPIDAYALSRGFLRLPSEKLASTLGARQLPEPREAEVTLYGADGTKTPAENLVSLYTGLTELWSSNQAHPVDTEPFRQTWNKSYPAGHPIIDTGFGMTFCDDDVSLTVNAKSARWQEQTRNSDGRGIFQLIKDRTLNCLSLSFSLVREEDKNRPEGVDILSKGIEGMVSRVQQDPFKLRLDESSQALAMDFPGTAPDRTLYARLGITAKGFLTGQH